MWKSFRKVSDIIKEETTDKRTIAETFHNFFINNGSNLPNKIPLISTKFESYFPNITTVPKDKSLLEKEFKGASPSYDNLHVNLIRSMYHELKFSLISIFS